MPASHSLRAIFLIVILTSAGTATATSVLVRNPNPVVPVEGSLSGSNDLTVDQQRLTYQGTAVDGMSVTVNNTASASSDFVVHAALEDSNGTILTERTTTTTSVAAGATKQVSIAFATTYDVGNVSQVEVTVEQTG